MILPGLEWNKAYILGRWRSFYMAGDLGWIIESLLILLGACVTPWVGWSFGVGWGVAGTIAAVLFVARLIHQMVRRLRFDEKRAVRLIDRLADADVRWLAVGAWGLEPSFRSYCFSASSERLADTFLLSLIYLAEHGVTPMKPSRGLAVVRHRFMRQTIADAQAQMAGAG